MEQAVANRAFASEPVQASYQLDQGPGRCRIGLIALDCDHATERDFMNMRPGDEVVIYTSRVRSAETCTVENLRSIAPLLTEAASLILPESRLDVIAYSCTSGTVVVGHEAIVEYIQAARPGIACVTPINAALAGLARFGTRRVAVLTPYVDEVNAAMARTLEAEGIDIVGFTSFHLINANDMANLPPEAIYQAALEADRADAEALFISCTAIRAVDVVEQLERALGKPVVTSIQAMFWQSLACAGYSKPINGYGRLLRLGS
jgi:maleate isomerase